MLKTPTHLLSTVPMLYFGATLESIALVVASVNGSLMFMGIGMLIVGAVATTAFWAKAQQQSVQRQQAWCWWQQRQLQQQLQQAESIRDGLLQQVFAFRRYLDQRCGQKPSATHDDESAIWLARFNDFYQTLEGLSNELSPPFVEDSLPLAIRSLLQSQQRQVSRLQVDDDWSLSSMSLNRLLLAVVVECLALNSDISNTAVEVRLWRVDDVNNLSLVSGMSHDRSVEDEIEPELNHLKQIFWDLMSGKLDIKTDQNQMVYQLSWPD